MTLKFILPVGHPQNDNVSAIEQYIESLRRILIFDADFFSAYNTGISYKFDETHESIDSFKSIHLCFPGVWTLAAAKMIQITMLPATHVRLKKLLGNDVPTPMYMTLGPVETSLPEQSLAQVQSFEVGSQIGTLIGSELYLTLQDHYGYYLNPLDYFQLFQENSLWDIPATIPCPLISSLHDGPIRIAGPNPRSGPTLIISGGSKNIEIHNPPEILPSSYYSFLASDPIKVSLLGGAENSLPTLQMINQCHQDHRSPQSLESLEIIAASDSPSYWEFSIQSTTMEPHHKTFNNEVVNGNPTQNNNGSRNSSQPLKYQVQISFEHNARTEIRFLGISQDTKDIIRQEYEFHRQPYQSGLSLYGLSTPERKELQTNQIPSFVQHFRASELQHSNYGPDHGNIVRNATEAYRVAEYMREQYRLQLNDLRELYEQAQATRRELNNVVEQAQNALNTNDFSTTEQREQAQQLLQQAQSRLQTFDISGIPPEISNAVRITSAWRNPERNESVGGKINSNHQYGRALDLRSFHAKQGGSPDDAQIHLAMFKAGRNFLNKLVELNTYAQCGRVEILLERYGKTLWQHRVSGNTVVSNHGSKYQPVTGHNPTDDTDNDMHVAAAHATHVHVSWISADATKTLILPTLPGETS